MTSLKYRVLNQFNPEYDADRLNRLDLLYKGGQRLIDNAHLFIPQEQGENMYVYNSRLKTIHYDNYLAEIINSYSADLCSKPLSVKSPMTPFYDEFFRDADLKHHSIADIIRSIFIKACITKSAFVGIDMPKINLSNEYSLLDEEQSGADRAYVFDIPAHCIIDWEQDDFGNYIWLVIRDEYSKRNQITSSRITKTICHKVWEQDQKTKLVSYKKYQLTLPIRRRPSDNDDCILVEQGNVSFKHIPVVRCKLPHELYISGLIANNCTSILQRKSSLYFHQKRGLNAIPVFKQGPEVTPGTFNEKAQDTYRANKINGDIINKGGLHLAENDSFEFVEAKGGAYQIVFEQIKSDINEIHRVTHTMASAISATDIASSYKSALSKIQDNKAKEIVLTAYADIMKDFIKRVYEVVASGRNETFPFEINGMDSYRIIDRQQVLLELAQIGQIPSKTLKIRTWQRLASEMEEDIPSDELDIINQEIETNSASLTFDVNLTNNQSPAATELANKSKDKTKGKK